MYAALVFTFYCPLCQQKCQLLCLIDFSQHIAPIHKRENAQLLCTETLQFFEYHFSDCESHGHRISDEA